MANILSQNEINELLSTLNSSQDTPAEFADEEKEKEVKPYDFRTANKFSKDQMRTLRFIYDNYAGRLSTLLSGTLRSVCEVEVVSVEEQSFSEFSNSMPSPVIVSIIQMPPLHGSMLLEISPVIAYEVISRLLGGTGYFQETDKPFTEIELSLLNRTIRKMVTLMDEAWERINKINAALERIETSAQYAQIVSANEPIAIITMNVTIGKVSDIINLCIPHVAVQPIAKRLVIKSWYSEHRNASKESVEKKNTGTGINHLYLNLHAVFDVTHASVRDILSTKVGDIIQIDHNINKQITVKVEHIPKFKGFIGTKDGKYAVQISEVIKGGLQDEYTEICT